MPRPVVPEVVTAPQARYHPHPMNPADLHGLPFAERIVYYPEVDSTRAAAARAAERGEDRTTLFLADHQSAGRGKESRKWFAPPGQSLLLTILTAQTAGIRSDSLALQLANSVAETLQREAGLRAAVKLPNDVQIEGRKIAGVLAEVIHPAARTVWLLSVGLNVTVREFPADLGQPATSVALEKEPAPGREALLRRFLGILAERFAP